LNQPGYGYRRPVDNSIIPNVIFALLVANGLVFALQQFQFEFMLKNFALWPINIPPELLSQVAPEHRPSFMPWQLVTYGFLHSTDYLGHIFFNMFGLWMFGRDLERLMRSGS
jgi:membrane associated rhomboid family serine protease